MSMQSILAMFGIGTAIAGTVTSSYGAYRDSKSKQRASEYEATVSRNNAQIAEWEAQDALDRGADAEQRHRLDVAALKGTQRATMASRGIALDEGSPLRILTDTDFMGELDARAIRENARRESWTKQNQARQYRDDAAWADYGADSESPLLAGATTLLTGASSVASRWYTYNREA